MKCSEPTRASSCSRGLVGWTMESNLRTELVVDAIGMAIWRRDPVQGTFTIPTRVCKQYTSLSFGKRLEEVPIVPSMGTVGSALDNAISESSVATLKAELKFNSQRPPSRTAAKTSIFEYLESFYNHSAYTPR